MSQNTITIDGKVVEYGNERNLLELIRKAGIDLPTFCYHSELSIYGACRLCIVEVEGRGIQGACSTPLEPGLKVKTSTAELREIRRITIELFLANHDMRCPSCPRADNCQLLDLARKLGVDNVRFRSVLKEQPVDTSSHSLIRNPNKCVLCGDCARVCSEVQDLGAIDFAFRGHDAEVVPTFNKPFGQSECVNCGQCAAVCPTGALTPKSEIQKVWAAIADPKKKVIVQIAPAVRVALGEPFGMEPGQATAGQAVAALKKMGFAQVFDTSFSADLTIFEEATEFLHRKQSGGKFPMFTSCCPAWVKYAEQYYSDLLPNLSSCRSPQGMMASIIKKHAGDIMGLEPKDVVTVSIMPCTAKKFEARRPELSQNGLQDCDFVLTTTEFAQMIKEAGLSLQKLEPESFDQPLGFKTGAGVIFGNSGGVMEAVLRFAAEKVTGEKLKSVDFMEVRGEAGLREATIDLGKAGKLKLAIVHGLGNAKKLAQKVRRGEADYDLIEVMACPGGCIGGGGQPVAVDPVEARRKRTRGLYACDKELNLHKSQENMFVTELYTKHLGGEVGGHAAHELLHTHYHNRRRSSDQQIRVTAPSSAAGKIKVEVCVGTSCFVRGSQATLQSLLREVDQKNLEEIVDVRASFCFERCDAGPSVEVNGKPLAATTAAKLSQRLSEELTACGIDLSKV